VLMDGSDATGSRQRLGNAWRRAALCAASQPTGPSAWQRAGGETFVWDGNTVRRGVPSPGRCEEGGEVTPLLQLHNHVGAREAPLADDSSAIVENAYTDAIVLGLTHSSPATPKCRTSCPPIPRSASGRSGSHGAGGVAVAL
jgi:hypothetical protein